MAVTAAQLKAEVLNRRYQSLLQKPEVFPSQRNWEYIIASRMQGGLGHLLYRKFLVANLTDPLDRVDYHILALNEFPRYIQTVDYAYACEVVYGDVTTEPEATAEIIRRYNLFNAERLRAMVEAGGEQRLLATSLLNIYQPEYTRADLLPMRRLLDAYDHLSQQGQITRQRGIFGVAEKYVCPRGHVNAPEAEYCQHQDCGLDIYGMTPEGRLAVHEYASQLDILEEMIVRDENNENHA